MAIPNAPSNLSATPLTASRIDLTWVDNSSDEANFELERSLNGTTGWTLVASPTANATSHSDTGLGLNTTYYYRLRAVNLDGNSAYSNTAFAHTLVAGRPPLEPRLFLLQPDVVFAARVNAPGTPTYPVTFVPFDGVTVGAYTDVSPGQTFILGSAPGLADYGRGRIRKQAEAASLFVGRSSYGNHDGELMIVDDAYITVWEDRRVWAKIPYIAADGTIYKDSALEVEDRTTNPPPVANLGAGFPATIDPISGLITAQFTSVNSYAVADDATIVSRLWDIEDGTLLGVGAALTDATITVTFPAGFRHVSLSVTDSNGVSQISYRPVYARDPEADTSFDAFAIESHRISDKGQSVTIRILADMPQVTYPDGTLALLWLYEPSGTTDRNHIAIIGWLDSEQNSLAAGRVGLQRDTTLTIVDVAGRLDLLPGFAQSVADDLSRDVSKIPAITWNYMIAPNLDKYMHYLLQWHSTALDVADFVWSGDGLDYPFALLSSDGDSLWNQVDRRARAFVPDRVLTCDRGGRLLVVPDPQLADVAARTSVVQAAIDEDEWSDLRYSYQRHPRVHWLRAGAVLAQAYADLPLDDAGQPILATVFSIAPGDTPGQGVGESTQGEQLAISQAALNAATGHRYARLNAVVGLLSLTLVQDDGAFGANLPWSELEPALKQWVTLTVSAATAARRGLTWTVARFLCKEMTIRYAQTKAGLARTLELTLELESVGAPGATVFKPGNVPPVGESPIVTVPPDSGLVGGQQLLAAIGSDGYRYKTVDFQTPSGSGGPTWTRDSLGIAATIYSFVVDPFSPGYAPGAVSGAVNGWVVNDTDIYRVSDLHGTTVATSVFTFPVATSGAALHWRSIQASFGAFFLAGVNPWLLCVSYYGDTAGHEGTWVTYSVNGGVTWSAEVLISAGVDAATPPRRNPVAVWASPRTPGKAMSAAYVSLAEDPAEPLPHWGVWNETTLALEEIKQGGAMTKTLSVTSPSGFGVVASDEIHLVLAPPATAVRVVLHGHYISTRFRDDTGGAFSETYTLDPAINTSQIEDLDYTPGVINGAAGEEEYDVTWTKTAGATWQGNRDDLAAMTDSDLFSALELKVQASTTGTTTATNTLWHRFVVTEIELANGHIYTPLPALVGAAGFAGASWGAVWTPTALIEPKAALAGQVYLPWDDNSDESLIYYGALTRGLIDSFALMRSAGGVNTDISPTATGVSFGINHFGFAVRSYDNDRQKLALGGIGNSTSDDPADDLVGLWVSSNAGTAWTNILAPVAASHALFGLQIAFSGTDSDVLFAWGAWSNSGSLAAIYYSSDFGATLDSREGNMNSLGTVAIIGIAGGPTP